MFSTKTHELNPTYENLRDTLLKDSIQRNYQLAQFITMLESIDRNCSIALDGAWGSGKTFFVKQAKMFLDANNPFVESPKDNHSNDNSQIKNSLCTFLGGNITLQPQIAIYYDAWENDNDTDPILSLVYSILQNIDTDYSELKTDSSCLTFVSDIIGLIKPFTSYNKDLSYLLTILQTAVNGLGKLTTSQNSQDILKTIRSSKKLHDQIDKFIDSLFSEHGDRLVIFIDELDRCRPNYAVELLERIKHYFTNDRVTFVFSTNISELQHTIKNYYGSNFDACRYLDRFFNYRASLPPIKESIYLNLLLSDYDDPLKSVFKQVIKTFNFQLREISHYLDSVEIAINYTNNLFSNSQIYPNRTVQFSLTYILPIMFGLYMANIDSYNDFINGKDPHFLLDILSSINIYNFKVLLDSDETFRDKQYNRNGTVDIKEKLLAIYDAVFKNPPSQHFPPVSIGLCSFNISTKNLLLETISLFSKYANYDSPVDEQSDEQSDEKSDEQSDEKSDEKSLATV